MAFPFQRLAPAASTCAAIATLRGVDSKQRGSSVSFRLYSWSVPELTGKRSHLLKAQGIIDQIHSGKEVETGSNRQLYCLRRLAAHMKFDAQGGIRWNGLLISKEGTMNFPPPDGLEWESTQANACPRWRVERLNVTVNPGAPSGICWGIFASWKDLESWQRIVKSKLADVEELPSKETCNFVKNADQTCERGADEKVRLISAPVGFLVGKDRVTDFLQGLREKRVSQQFPECNEFDEYLQQADLTTLPEARYVRPDKETEETRYMLLTGFPAFTRLVEAWPQLLESEEWDQQILCDYSAGTGNGALASRHRIELDWRCLGMIGKIRKGLGHPSHRVFQSIEDFRCGGGTGTVVTTTLNQDAMGAIASCKLLWGCAVPLEKETIPRPEYKPHVVSYEYDNQEFLYVVGPNGKSATMSAEGFQDGLRKLYTELGTYLCTECKGKSVLLPFVSGEAFRHSDVPIEQVCSIARDALTRSISQGRSDGNALLYLDPLFVKDIRNDMKRIDAPRDMPTMVQTHIDRQMVDTVVVATRDAQGEWKYEVYNRVKDRKRQVPEQAQMRGHRSLKQPRPP